MAFDLDPELPLGTALRKVAAGQLDGAARSLGRMDDDPDAAVHDIRKRTKKLRGLLRLFRPGFEETFRAENRVLRDLARSLSGRRDAAVMARTARALAPGPGAAAEALGPLLDRLDAAAEPSGAAGAPSGAVGAALDGLRGRIDAWCVEDAPAALRKGLGKTYGRAREALQVVTEDPRAAEFHDLRKRVKYHGFHCRLLRRAWPDEMAARRDVADRLSDLLGDDHDLSVLAETLRDDPGMPPDAVAVATALIADRSAGLRARALALAPRLLAEPPGALSRRMAAYWTAEASRRAARAR